MLRPRVRRNNIHGSSLELEAGSRVDTGFLMLCTLPANSSSGVECTEKGDGIQLVENKIECHEIEAPWKNVIHEESQQTDNSSNGTRVNRVDDEGVNHGVRALKASSQLVQKNTQS